MHEHFAQRLLGRMCRVTVKGDRLDVEHLGFVRAAEILQLAAAIRARTLRRCNEVIDVFEVLGQFLAPDRLSFDRLRGLEPGRLLGHCGCKFLEGQGQLPAVHLLGGLAEPCTAQLRQLELQVFDLPIPLAQLNILGLRSGVMLDDEALKSRYIIRQHVDIEHGFIIPAASIMRAAFCLFL